MKPFQTIRTLLCLTVCLGVLLWGCSSEGLPGAPSVPPEAPASKTEQMMAAMDKGSALLDEAEARTGFSVFDFLNFPHSDGTVEEALTVRRLAVMGTDYIGGDPMTLRQDSCLLEGVRYLSGSFGAAGETVPFKRLIKEGVQYLHLPGLKDGTYALPYTKTSLSASMLVRDVRPLRDRLGSMLTDDLINVIHRDGGTEYVAVLGEAHWQKLAEVMELSGFHEMKGEGGTLSFAVSVFVTDTRFVQKAVLKSGEATLLTASYSLTERQGELAYRVSVAGDGTLLLEASGSITVSEKSMAIRGKLTADGTTADYDVSLTAAGTQKAVLAGSFALSATVEEEVLRVPMTVTGVLEQKGEVYSYTAATEASLAGVLELSMEYTTAFSHTPAELPTDFAGLKPRETDVDGLMDDLREVYPGTAELYDALFRGGDAPVEDVTAITYRDEDGSLILSLYSDSTVGLSLQGDFSMADGTVSLSYKGHELFSVPYTANENNTFTIWDTTFTYYADSTMDTYAYLSADGTRWIEIMPILSANGLALFDLCLPVTVTETALEIRTPDEGLLCVPYAPGEDGLTVRLWDLELKYAVSE